MEVGTIRTIDIDHEMRGAYLDYAMSVIVARALPDARDGLKPVHRRILYAMHDMGMAPDKPYRKSARIVGEVLGKYHPHGDSAVYDAMARMAQDFSMRYPLVDGQGNFGSIDGDAPAAMRYTEARLAPIALEMLADIDKDTVDWIDNFDGSLKEPLALPACLPNLLLNGTSGIAVGMATNIPPHNLNELADGIAYVLDNYERVDEIGVEELLQFVHGPDFPTGGLILGDEGIRAAYATGKGRLVIRAVSHFEELKGGRQQIVFTEIPYQVNKTALLERIAELVHSGKIDDISDMRDESDRGGMRIIIELKRTAQPRKVLNKLLKYTPLQSTFSINLLALVDNEPRVLSLKRALIVYIEHRRDIVTRRTRFELEKARQRAHILEGLRIALEFLDEVIALIRASKDAEEARRGLMQRFALSEVQAQAILDMPLRRLAALERQKIEDEYNEVLARIHFLEELLANPQKLLGVVRDELMALKERFGDERRTQIVHDTAESLNDEDLVAQEHVIVTLTERSYIKRAPARLYRAQGRGGRGVQGMTTREEDSVRYLVPAYTLERMLFFTNRGRAFQERVFQIPDAGRNAKGASLANVLNLDAGEVVTTMLPAPDAVNGDIEKLKGRYLVMVTAQAKIKRMELSELASIRPSGIVALSLDAGDELGWVRLTNGEDDIIIVSQAGRALRFKEDEVRCMGRAARGVGAMRLEAGDRLASVEVVEPGAALLIVTASGHGKRTPLDEYPRRGRAGGGVIALSHADKAGGIAAARVVKDEDDVIIISEGGIVLRQGVVGIPLMGRTARGARLIKLKGDDRAVSIARVTPEPAGEAAPAAAAVGSDADEATPEATDAESSG